MAFLGLCQRSHQHRAQVHLPGLCSLAVHPGPGESSERVSQVAVPRACPRLIIAQLEMVIHNFLCCVCIHSSLPRGSVSFLGCQRLYKSSFAENRDDQGHRCVLQNILLQEQLWHNLHRHSSDGGIVFFGLVHVHGSMAHVHFFPAIHPGNVLLRQYSQCLRLQQLARRVMGN